MARVVIVSNRVPPPSRREAAAGGLAVALKDALTPGTLWFGWSGTAGDSTDMRARTTEMDGGVTLATIDLSRDDYNRYYVGYANSALWPLFHFRLGLVEFRREDFEGYRDVNRSFAAALAPLLRPDDLVWVHDYHLIPLAAELRDLGVRNRIGFFLHIPFVPSSVFMALPQGDRLLAMMTAYDVAGFQTEQDRHSFLDCLSQLMHLPADPDGRVDVGGRMLQVVANPIGIDPDAFQRDAIRAARSADGKRLLASLQGRTLVMGADRLDYSKGLPQRFDGFRRLLARFPEHRRKVSYLQVAARSREDVDRYKDLRRELDRLTGAINGRYADVDWNPLRYMTRSVSRRTLAGCARLARIGLVTPLRDGMNLVAKEFVAAQSAEDPGVLILSKFAGAAHELDAALVVNPNDPEEIAEALDRALRMPLDERIVRHRALRERVWETTAATWSRRFLAALRGEDGGIDASEPLAAA